MKKEVKPWLKNLDKLFFEFSIHFNHFIDFSKF